MIIGVQLYEFGHMYIIINLLPHSRYRQFYHPSHSLAPLCSQHLLFCSPWQSLICLLSLQFSLFQNVISKESWSLLSLSSFFQRNALRFIYVVAGFSSTSLFNFKYHSIPRMYHCVFIHSSTEGRLGCFQFFRSQYLNQKSFLMIILNVLNDIFVHIFSWIPWELLSRARNTKSALFQALFHSVRFSLMQKYH